LGVNPIPFKTCNHSCIYCQLGSTTHLTNTRWDFFFREEIQSEINQALESHASQADYLTFVGEGEPTLCRSLGQLIEWARETTTLPIAVITNGSLLCREKVRQELTAADLVMPSLDAADQRTYRRINRPHRSLRIDAIVEGMARFREVFPGKLWIEVMLVRGVNDSEQALSDLRKALSVINPDRIFLNVPIRPPAESWVRAPDAAGLARAHGLLADATLITQPESGDFATVRSEDPLAAVLMIIRRHPMHQHQILKTLKRLCPTEVDTALKQLEASGRVQRLVFGQKIYYAAAEGRYALRREGRKPVRRTEDGGKRQPTANVEL
jgi:wyosine [tRNA(Phe)-imidazoG37] synthetase (radical SAM superfamily)